MLHHFQNMSGGASRRRHGASSYAELIPSYYYGGDQDGGDQDDGGDTADRGSPQPVEEIFDDILHQLARLKRLRNTAEAELREAERKADQLSYQAFKLDPASLHLARARTGSASSKPSPAGSACLPGDDGGGRASRALEDLAGESSRFRR